MTRNGILVSSSMPASASNGRSTSRVRSSLRRLAVPAHLSDELGLKAGAYLQSVTANGTVTTRATRIEALAFGPFDLRRVPASLNPGMTGNEVLLGMSVLKHLEFTQRGDTLVLRTLGR